MKGWSTTRRSFLQGTVAAGAATLAVAPFREARSAAYPSDDINVVIPTREGGGADRNFRAFTGIWKKYLKTKFGHDRSRRYLLEFFLMDKTYEIQYQKINDHNLHPLLRQVKWVAVIDNDPGDRVKFMSSSSVRSPGCGLWCRCRSCWGSSGLLTKSTGHVCTCVCAGAM